MPSTTPQSVGTTRTLMASPQPEVRRNRLTSCTQHTTKKPGRGDENYSPHLCDNMGQKDAFDGAGARLGTYLEGSNAGFVPPMRDLGLLDETAGA